jgi:hypothetical protein
MTAIAQYDRQFPDDNARFLDALIDEVRVITGRIYGVSSYVRLLDHAGPAVGVTRRPSNTTIQKAIDRAQTATREPTPHDDAPEPDAGALELPLLRRALEPMLRDVMASVPAVLEQMLHQHASGAAATMSPAAAEQAFALELAQASLDDARRRMRALEDEAARLRRELGSAETRAAMAEARIATLLEDIHRTIRESAAGVEALAQAAQRLEGTEQYLKRQHDAVRRQATAEVEGLRERNKQLAERVDQLMIENAQYRRVVSAQRRGGPD